MKKTHFLIFISLLFLPYIKAQDQSKNDLAIGLKFQKTEQLYWENGVAADFTSDFLLQKRIHIKCSYTTSRLGSALIGNAIRQDNFIVGADWHFRSTKDLQILAGLNTGFFNADMEQNQVFSSIPHSSMLFGLETGLFYKFKIPVATSLTVNYNLINGDGVKIPGSLFPVYYQLSVFYYIGKNK